MSKKYIIAYQDDSGAEVVAPKTVHVSYGDKVIWANYLTDSYTATNFVYDGPGLPPPGQLFPADNYPMPPNGQSSPAQVQISQNGSFRYKYDCTDGSSFLDPVIIVDNPGTGDGDGTQATKPGGKRRKPTPKGKTKPKGKAKPKSKKAAGKKSKAGKRR